MSRYGPGDSRAMPWLRWLQRSIGLVLSIYWIAGCSPTSRSTPDSRQPSASVARAMITRLAQSEIWTKAKVIGFGETTHGTREFRSTFYGSALLAAKHAPAITVALEVDPASARDWNEWIAGCGHQGYGSKVKLPVASASHRAFLEQAREHNLSGGGCIRVVGVDAPASEYTLNVLQHYAQSCLTPHAYELVQPKIDDLQAMSAAFGTGDDRPGQLLATVKKETREHRSGQHCLDFDWWLHLSKRHVGIERDSPPQVGLPQYVHTLDRDALMAQNVVFWSGQEGKVFWLAHAFHTAKVVYPHVRGPGHTTPAGLHVERSLREHYVSVGLFFGEGTLFARGCGKRSRNSVRHIPPPGRPCLQSDLGRDLSEPALLPSQAACQGRNCTEVRSYVNCLPRGWKDPAVAYLSLDVATAFDWIAYFPLGSADEFTYE